jgi:hypothetical protein
MTRYSFKAAAGLCVLGEKLSEGKNENAGESARRNRKSKLLCGTITPFGGGLDVCTL